MINLIYAVGVHPCSLLFTPKEEGITQQVTEL